MGFCPYYDKQCPENTDCYLWNGDANACTFQKHTDMLQEIIDGQQGGGGLGADVKNGSLIPASKVWVLVSFTTPFASTPSVTGGVSKNTTWSLRNVAVDGFEVYLNTTGNNTFWWIATDAGNP